MTRSGCYIEFDDDYEDDFDYQDNLCPYCNGDGWGLVGVDWDCEDGINGPFDGESQQCPWCHGSGKANDVDVW